MQTPAAFDDLYNAVPHFDVDTAVFCIVTAVCAVVMLGL